VPDRLIALIDRLATAWRSDGLESTVGPVSPHAIWGSRPDVLSIDVNTSNIVDLMMIRCAKNPAVKRRGTVVDAHHELWLASESRAKGTPFGNGFGHETM
jgi:hypothetical protein